MTGRDLVVVRADVTSTAKRTVQSRPAGPFLAQLIATALQAPQTRVRRRAELRDVRALYAAVAAGPAGLPPRLCRTM